MEEGKTEEVIQKGTEGEEVDINIISISELDL